MSQQQSEAQASTPEAVMRTFVRGRLASKELVRTMEGTAICRLVVIGEARGPASSPPRVSLYIGEGGDLREDEARRCASNLGEGDLIQAVGDVGPQRPGARWQEIVVSEPVRLRARKAVAG